MTRRMRAQILNVIAAVPVMMDLYPTPESMVN